MAAVVFEMDTECLEFVGVHGLIRLRARAFSAGILIPTTLLYQPPSLSAQQVQLFLLLRLRALMQIRCVRPVRKPERKCGL